MLNEWKFKKRIYVVSLPVVAFILSVPRYKHKKPTNSLKIKFELVTNKRFAVFFKNPPLVLHCLQGEKCPLDQDLKVKANAIHV